MIYGVSLGAVVAKPGETDRERAGCEASPTAAVIDSQSVETTEGGGIRSYGAGKKIKGAGGRV